MLFKRCFLLFLRQKLQFSANKEVLMPFYEDYGFDFYLYHITAHGNSGIMHLHPHWEMLLVPTAEETKITINGNVYTTNEPMLALFAPFCLHKVEFLEIKKPIERFVCYFGDNVFRDYFSVFSDYHNVLSQNFVMFPLSEELCKKCRHMIDQTADYKLHSKEQKLLFLLILCTVLNEHSDDRLSKSTSDFLQLSRIMKYMYEHLAERMDADSVAQQFYISRSKLDKDFQKYTTVSFRQLLIDMRLSHAAYLLASNPHQKISDIATMSGFENENYFYSQFKQLFGTTPLKYQKDPLKYIRNVRI